MGIRKPIGVCLAAVGLGALLASSPAAAAPPEMKSAPVTKGIKPMKPKEEPAKPAESAKPDPKPAETPKPAPSAAAPAASAAKPAPSAGIKPTPSGIGSAVAPPAGNDPGLGSLKNGKHEERLDALRVRIESKKKTAPERKRVEAERTRIRWGALVEHPAVRAELSHHGKRVARLERIRELAIVEGKQAVADRASKALDKENARHEARMAALAAGGGK